MRLIESPDSVMISHASLTPSFVIAAAYEADKMMILIYGELLTGR